jgi:hypothetical protein
MTSVAARGLTPLRLSPLSSSLLPNHPNRYFNKQSHKFGVRAGISLNAGRTKEQL